MADQTHISFLIDHIDPLGQGVFKKDDQIFFIPKTLPGEEGEAEILKSKKNLHFCKTHKAHSTFRNKEKFSLPSLRKLPWMRLSAY